MKKIIKFLSPLFLLVGLSGCFGNLPLNPYKTVNLPSPTSGGGGGSGGGGSEGPTSVDEAQTRVIFLIDYNAPAETPWEEQDVYGGDKIVAPKKTPTSYDAPDPAFTTFLGWSIQPLLDGETDTTGAKLLWDFENDTVPEDLKTLYIYGVWVAM